MYTLIHYINTKKKKKAQRKKNTTCKIIHVTKMKNKKEKSEQTENICYRE